MRTRNYFPIGLAASAALLLTCAKPLFAQVPPAGIRNVVLVHGAFADGSSWSKVITRLEAQGYHVTAVQNPLTSLADDVAATKRAIALQQGPVLLVGHSWGGAVISEAGNDPKVAGLVYVAAFAPDDNQSVSDLGQDLPAAPGVKEIQPDAAGFGRLTWKGVNEFFAQDLPVADRKAIYSQQGPIFLNNFKQKVSTAAWHTRPSYYIVAANDGMINPALQQRFAANMKAVTVQLKTSHVPMVSQPAEVAKFIAAAAKSAQASGMSQK